MDLYPRHGFNAEAASASSDRTSGWGNALLPIFALSRLFKSIFHRPDAKAKTSRLSTFPTFKNDELRYIVSFGDSFTATDFNPFGHQPDRTNPMGNPAWPGTTSANGPNWIDYLTVEYNRSYIETINLAGGGGKLDSSVIGPSNGGGIVYQFHDWFTPAYGSSPRFFPWTSAGTVFTIYVGTNDIGAIWNSTDRERILDRNFVSYAGLLDAMYAIGARNVVLLNVMPLHRAPGVRELAASDEQLEMWRTATVSWNERLERVVRNLTDVYPDARAGVVDTYGLFQTVLNYPCSSRRTCPIRETVAPCEDYLDKVRGQFAKSEQCRYYVDQYFWRDGFHVMWRVHEMLAEAIAGLLWAD